MDKNQVAAILRHIGMLLELKGENPFKIRAYVNGARTIEMLDEDIDILVAEKRLGNVPGIGKTLLQTIEELVTSGGLKYYEELKSEFPEGIFDLFKVRGLGAKKIGVLYNKLGISSIGELEYACHENRLETLPGFGAKTQENILKAIEQLKKYSQHYLIHEADRIAMLFIQELRECEEICKLSIGDSLRRRKEIIKDIDIVVASDNPTNVNEYIVNISIVEEVTGQGPTKTSVILKEGMAVDVRIVSEEQFPYALHHFTGSKEHNTKMRHIAKSKGIKMNEYGLFKGEEEELIKCRDEGEIFRTLGMTYIPPELREDMGEIEAALENRLPSLVKDEDLAGIFHMHTNYSDGSKTVRELAQAAKQLGYSYIGISDHSRSAFYANGLSVELIEKQLSEIDQINKELDDFYIFKGIESDILQDGSLDYPDEILERFDFVIASVHSQFKMDREMMTKRILTALDNPYTTILGHPTGRLLLSRDGYELDMDKILDRAAENNVIIEINANPHRLDLDWRWVKKGKEKGIRFAICPDAHDTLEFHNTAYGVFVARKGWLEPVDVINTLSVEDVKKIFLSKRK